EFEVQGPPLVVSGADGSDTLDVLNLTVFTSGGCPATAAKVRGSRLGTKIKAKWAGCGGVVGPHRFAAVIDPAPRNTMPRRVKSRGLPKRSFVAQRAIGGTAPTGSTFDTVQSRIFGAHGCAVSTCHGPIKAANLDLRAGASYANLINISSTIAPSKKRVMPGD